MYKRQVQDRSITGNDQARLAGFLMILGMVLFALLALLSWPVATFFAEPAVAALVSALGVLCVTDALQVVPLATLQKELAYRQLAGVQFLQVLVTQATLVGAALLGLGVWSLVANAVVGAVAAAALLVWLRPYAMHWPRNPVSLSRPLLQGWRMLVSRFAWYAYSSADRTVVGRVLGANALGIYSFGTTLSMTVSEEITAAVGRVVPGVFSGIQQDRAAVRRYFLLLTELLCWLCFPISFGIAVTADLIVPLVLGPQWDAVVLPLQLLCLYAAFYASQVLQGHVLLWTGHFRANMWCSIFGAAVMPLAFYLGSRWGVPGVAWAWVIAFPLANIPAFVVAFRIAGINVFTWIAVIAPALVCSLLMVGCVAFARATALDDVPMVTETVVSIVTGALAYCGASWLLFRVRVRRQLALLRALRQPTAEPARIPAEQSAA